MKKQKTPSERVLELLLKPNARYKFKHLVALSKLTSDEVSKAIAELRKTYPNLVFSKFDKTFYFADTPTWYSNQTDLSQEMPLEGSFGLLSDTHLCSIAERLDILNLAYDMFAERGIKQVFHCGDISDGFCSYPGHMGVVRVYGNQPQAAYVIKNYPSRPGITTYVIGGNHDLDSYGKDKVDRVSLITHGFYLEGHEYTGRTDIVYLGQYSHTIILPLEVTLHLLHPRGNAPYAISYKQQKRSESMDRNLRPDIQASGHFHTFNFCWLQGSYFIGLPGLQDETEYFKRLGLPRNVGFTVIHYKIKDGKIVSLSPEIFMFA